MVVLGQDLPDAEADPHLGVGEMSHDLLARPLAGPITPREARVAEPPRHRLDALGVLGQGLERVAVAQQPQQTLTISTVGSSRHLNLALGSLRVL